MLRIKFVLLIFTIQTQWAHGQNNHLPTRLIPPPSNLNIVNIRRTQYPISQSTLHLQSGASMLAKLHTNNARGPASLSTRFNTPAEQLKHLMNTNFHQNMLSFNRGFSLPPMNWQNNNQFSVGKYHTTSPFVPSARHITMSPKFNAELSKEKLKSIRFLDNTLDTRNSATVTPVTKPSLPSDKKIGKSTFPEPQIVWGDSHRPKLLTQYGKELAAQNSLYPPLKDILFQKDGIYDNGSWKPLHQPIASPIEMDKENLPSFDKISNLFASWTAPLPLTTQNPIQNLYVKTTPKPQHFLSPSLIFRSDIGKRQVSARAQELAPFFVRFSTTPPAKLESSEFVIHLNSTDRVQKLMNFLSKYLQSPSHQLNKELHEISALGSSEFAPWSEEFYLTTSNPPNKIPTSYQTKFRNGFLDLLYLNNQTDHRGLANIDEDDFKNFSGTTKLFDNLVEVISSEVVEPLQNPQNSIRVTPQPVKIDVFQDFDSYDTASFEGDLIYSPSISTLLGISTVSNATIESNFSVISNENEIGLTTHDDEFDLNAVKISAKTSECPKLYGKVDLLCEINSNETQNLTWKKRMYSDDGEESEQMLSHGSKMMLSDPRISLLRVPPPNTYALRITAFRSRDAGTYECQLRSPEGHPIASSQVLVIMCF